MPTYYVVHGSVSGRQVGEAIELTKEQADHINSSGKMLRAADEKEQPKQRTTTLVRSGLEGTKTVRLSGTVVGSEPDAEAAPVETEEEVAPKFEEPTKSNKRKRGG